MNNIILIGYMASGKTTIGKELATELNMDFADTDAMIVKQAGMSINEIFSRFGQDHFRNLESKCVKGLKDLSRPTVISTGGGMVLRDENALFLKAAGFVIFLNVSPETVLERVKYDTTRPLLREKDPLDTIKRMLSDRMDKYLVAADMVVDVDNKSIGDITAEIITAKR